MTAPVHLSPAERLEWAQHVLATRARRRREADRARTEAEAYYERCKDANNVVGRP